MVQTSYWFNTYRFRSCQTAPKTLRKPPAGRSVFRPTPAKLTAGTNSNAVVASGRPPRTLQLQDLMTICKTPNFGLNFEF
ncbi:unnamed protein product [Cuscuta campestris]|uniref:Uncharacterized protein n=1 Tax=Cuscuta campestris TaxID=132261 RepID=A0A484KH33_9ASTE|nr:unnamed protein product [Cuscuta campestris]